MSTVIALLLLTGLFLGLAHLTRNDRFTGPAPLDPFRDSDGFLITQIRRLQQ